MTETHDGDATRSGAADGTQTLADVSHTHPDTGRSFGGNFTFARGGAVAADGGRPDVVPEDGDGDAAGDGSPETLADVEHTPPNGSEDANRVFERGVAAREQRGSQSANVAANGDGERRGGRRRG